MSILFAVGQDSPEESQVTRGLVSAVEETPGIALLEVGGETVYDAGSEWKGLCGFRRRFLSYDALFLQEASTREESDNTTAYDVLGADRLHIVQFAIQRPRGRGSLGIIPADTLDHTPDAETLEVIRALAQNFGAATPDAWKVAACYRPDKSEHFVYELV